MTAAKKPGRYLMRDRKAHAKMVKIVDSRLSKLKKSLKEGASGSELNKQVSQINRNLDGRTWWGYGIC